MSRSRRHRGWPPPDDVTPLPAPVTDNHTHLPVPGDTYPGPGSEDPLSAARLVERAAAVGVARTVTSACEAPTWLPSLELARTLPGVRVALAVHPNEAVLHAGVREVGPDGLPPRPAPHHGVGLEEAIDAVGRLAREHAEVVVAIGETGIDLFRTGEQGREAQIAAFRAHVALAKELGLPLQIHDRDAHADCVAVLEADGAPERTIFHCFSGDVELARTCAAHGWYASVAGPVTYPANETLRAAVAEIPAGLLLVETDAPYLAPVPFRGGPNASYLLPATVAFLAEQRRRPLDELCRRLELNTDQVYGRW